MEFYDINAFSDDEEVVRHPKLIRPRTDFFEEYDQKDFFDRFRLTRRTTEPIVEEIRDLIDSPTERNDCLSASDQVLLALNFYGNGSFLRTVSELSGVSKFTASRVVRKVSAAIATWPGSSHAHFQKF
ncbi:uncharacterized protein [Leptinotarsa decemlineata]|uniref:uncharacterized protein n=1 Tax=Leptinotarsa decemlineata TaxID=7539 RepID=UPI003D308ED6